MKKKQKEKKTTADTEAGMGREFNADKKIAVQAGSTRKLALFAMFTAVALIFSYMETLIPVYPAIPGIKLGLANIVTIVVLNRYGVRDTVLISFVRIILSALLFGNLTVMLYSLAGAACSIIIMWLFLKLHFFSLTGISILGGVSHNIGQLLVAAVLIENQNILSYAPVLLITGTVAGIAVGIAASFIIKSIKTL